jgi:demethylmenaquinone methyltransferase/2-methoxy-6-polyprenyl-1,4-benzoquinol methylase
LAVAQRRAAAQPWLPLRFHCGDALATGLDGGWADGAAIAYGLRNLSDPGAGLRELRRLLRPGGRAAVLDFNRPETSPGLAGAETMAAFQRFYLRRLVVPAASSIGLSDQYAYLESSLRRFPGAMEQESLARAAGFRQVRHRPLAAGLMGLLELEA